MCFVCVRDFMGYGPARDSARNGKVIARNTRCIRINAARPFSRCCSRVSRGFFMASPLVSSSLRHVCGRHVLWNERTRPHSIRDRKSASRGRSHLLLLWLVNIANANACASNALIGERFSDFSPGMCDIRDVKYAVASDCRREGFP